MIDPSLINEDDLLRQSQEIGNSMRDRDQLYSEYNELQEQLNQIEEEEANPKKAADKKRTENIDNDESVKAVRSGLALSAESLLTFPERAIDMTTGEYQRQVEEEGEYKVDNKFLGLVPWLQDIQENNKTETWWGGLIEMGAHYGSLGGFFRAVGPAGKITNATGRDLAIGAASDLVSSESQDANATQEIVDGQLLKRIPWIDEILLGAPRGTLQEIFDEGVAPILGTKDSDHPWLKTLKNAAEGVGLDMLVSKVLSRLDPVEDVARKQNITDQVDEAAAVEVAEDTAARDAYLRSQAVEANRPQLTGESVDVDVIPEAPEVEGTPGPRALPPAGQPGNQFRAHKNKDIADPWQGNPVSGKSPYDVGAQADYLGKTWPTPGAGSTDSVYTSKQLEVMTESVDVSEKEFRKVIKNIMSDDRYQEVMASARNAGQDLRTYFGDAYKRMQEALGRDYSEMDPDEFWEIMSQDTDIIAGQESWNNTSIWAADLINASLFKQIRDFGLGMREIKDVADLMDIDGPMKATVDRLIVGLTHVRRSRYLAGAKLQGLDFGNADLRKAAEAKVAAMQEESKQAIKTYLDIAQRDDSDEMIQALAEFFAMSDDVVNLKDFDSYMRAKLRGGEFNGKMNRSRVIKELGSVMVHSILSGIKTPLRAMMGTFTASFTRPLATGVGAFISGDKQLARASFAGANAYIQTIPEAYKLFRRNLSAYWAGDIANLKTRYTEGVSKDDQHWEMMGKWAMSKGTEMDKLAYRLADIARTLNSKNFLTYNTKIMGATDDAFGLLMARARAREKAMLMSMDKNAVGEHVEITPELLKDMENLFMSKLYDADGNIDLKRDLFLESQVKEATLTTDLQGFAKRLEGLFDAAPFLKPFFLFARTGINGLEVSLKHMPGLNFILEEQRLIANATADNIDSVRQFGIQDAADLANAKALMKGRMAIGSAVTLMAGMYYAGGNLTGNGPQDRRLRQLWLDSGWQPRSFKVPTPAGDVWVSYEAFEPFNNILAAIADIGDNQALMGEQWAENNLFKISLAVAGGVVSKSYLQGIGQLVDLVSNEPYQIQKIAGNIANNTIPLAGLRGDIGRTLNSPMREINKDLFETIRNRNLTSEYIAIGGDLPAKYDVLNGQKIRDWNFVEKMFNLISPVSVSLNQSPGRTLLWNSNYDLRLVSYTSPDGIPLKDHPKLRSEFQKYLGRQGLEATLDRLSTREDVQDSVNRMNSDRRNGRNELDPMKAYLHNKLIKERMEKARKRAWAQVRRANPDLTRELYDDERLINTITETTRRETSSSLDYSSLLRTNNP
jgi:hypothetical protein